MLKAAGCIRHLGHSERRQYFGDQRAVNAKRAGGGLRRLSVGETLAERRRVMSQIITTQIGLPVAPLRCQTAWSPMSRWAIGTGCSHPHDPGSPQLIGN
jgi:triosephosphate isomerase